MTVSDTYAASHAATLALLAQLQQTIEDLPNPEDHSINWGHVGSLSHINAQLQDLLAFAS